MSQAATAVPLPVVALAAQWALPTTPPLVGSGGPSGGGVGPPPCQWHLWQCTATGTSLSASSGTEASASEAAAVTGPQAPVSHWQ